MTINDIDESLQVPADQQADETKQVNDEKQAPNQPVSEEINTKAIADMLDIDTDDNNYNDDIRIILEYALTQTDHATPEEIKWVVREMQDKLGTPPYLEDKVHYIARYAYLLLESKKTQKELEEMTRRGNG